jgi:hypothetical protein
MIFMIIIRLTDWILQLIFISKRLLMRPHTTKAPRSTQAAKELMMHTNAHTTPWGTLSGSGRARETKRWYQQLRDWWTAHQAARRQASLDALHRCWDATREAVTPHRAEAAPEMAVAHHAISVATMLYGLSQ